MKLAVVVASALLACAAPPALSATIFSEDFSGATPGTYSGQIPGTKFTDNGADVDIIGVLNGSFFTCVGNPSGNCVDLVGNQGPGSVLTSTPIALTAGDTYTIGFTDNLQGFNSGDPVTSDFTVALGSFTANLVATPDLMQRSLSFVASASDPAAVLSFATTTSPDSVHGPILSGITVTDTTAAVPEPASWAMFIGGFGMLGGAMRRRRTTLAYS